MPHISDLIQAARTCCWDALVQLVPELKSLEGQHQHASAGVDVAEHTRRMLVQCPEDDNLLKLACAFHDIAKPITARPKEGKPSFEFPNHGFEGAHMVLDILPRFEDYESYLGELVELVLLHMEPHNGRVPAFSNSQRLVDLAELDSAGFANKSIGKVRERFNKIRVKFGHPEKPFPPPETVDKTLEEYLKIHNLTT